MHLDFMHQKVRNNEDESGPVEDGGVQGTSRTIENNKKSDTRLGKAGVDQGEDALIRQVLVGP